MGRVSIDWGIALGLLQVIVLVYQVYIQYKAELGERGVLLPFAKEPFDSVPIQTELTLTADVPLEAVGHGVVVEDYRLLINGVQSKFSHPREEQLLYPGTNSKLSVVAEIPQETMKRGEPANSFTIETCLQLRTLAGHVYRERLKMRLCQSSSNRCLWHVADCSCRIEDGFWYWVRRRVFRVVGTDRP